MWNWTCKIPPDCEIFGFIAGACLFLIAPYCMVSDAYVVVTDDSYRIKLRSHGRSKQSTVFVSFLVLAHWVSFIGLLAWRLQNPSPILPGERLPLLLFGGLGIYLALMVRDRWRVLRAPPYIEFSADRVLLCRGRYGSMSEWVAYEDIESFHVTGRPPLRFCLITAYGRNYFFAETRFPTKDAFSMFMLELRTRIRSLPEGEKQIAIIDHNVSLARAIWAKPAQVTYALVIIIFLAFTWEYSSGALDEPFKLVRFGANAPLLFGEGQYYRLVLANFLHVGWLHVTLNTMALYSLGSVVERLLGSTRYIILYLLTGIAGAFVSVLFAQAPLSVGASTAIFGILGGLLTLNLKFRGRLPASFSQSRAWWTFILGTSAALPLVLPQIDAGAHFGGFGMGILLTYVLIRNYEPERLFLSTATPLIKLVAAVSLTVCVLSVVLGLTFAGQTQEKDEIRVMTQFVASAHTPAADLNHFAWNIVIDSDASKELRQLAGEAARRAVEKAPDRPELLDTLASVYFMHGSIEEAIELESEAISKLDALVEKRSSQIESDILEESFAQQFLDFRNVLVSQLFRFEYAQFLKQGPPLEAWQVALRLEAPTKSGTRKIHLRLDKPYSKGIEIHAVVVRGSLLIGHIVIQLAGSSLRELSYEFREGPALTWSKSARLDIVFVKEKQLSESNWTAGKYAAEIARLPLLSK